jgi:hypothetical protein
MISWCRAIIADTGSKFVGSLFMDINNALELIQRKLYGWMRELIRMLPNLLLAALVILASPSLLLLVYFNSTKH